MLNRRTIILAFAFLYTWLLAACGVEQQTEDPSDVLTSEFQSRYIDPYVAGDIDAWMDVFADDVVAMHDGLPPLDGKESVRGFGEAVAKNFAITRLDAVVDEVRQNGNWAWTRGHFVAVFDEKTDSAPPGVAGERHGKFLLIWERQDDGTWLVVMDIGNRLPAPVVTTQSDAGLYYSCRSCHGEHGEGNEAMDAPAIAGMDAEYLATQMRHFRDGVRGATLDDLEGRQMNLIAAIFEDDRQIDALANFIQTMPREKPPRVLAESPVGAAQRFALCAACHGPNGEGNRLLGGPAIAWLDDWYIALQLQKFRDGIRGADAADVRGQQMRAAASALSDDEIRELAAFVVTLPGRASGN